MHCIPDDTVATIMSINVGNPLVLESPNSKPAVAIKKLTESLMGIEVDASQSNGPQSATAMKAAAVLALNTLPFCR